MLDGTPGRSFGRVAEIYDRARPDYPPKAVLFLASKLGLARGSAVLDLGAGTGKLTRLLRERFAQVVAVEPDDDMRALIGGDARAGSGESVPAGDAEFDAVFVADAFHWFDAERALPEIRRVVRPGGGLALLWNRWDVPSEGGARDLLDETWRRFHGDDTVFGASPQDAVAAAFGPLGHRRFERKLRYSGDDYADLCITASCPSALPDDERADLRRMLREALGPTYVLSVPTDVYWRRLP